MPIIVSAASLFGAIIMMFTGIISFFCKNRRTAVSVGFTGVMLGVVLTSSGILAALLFRGSNYLCREHFPQISSIIQEHGSMLSLGIIPLVILAFCCALHAVDYIHKNHNIFWGFFSILVSSIMLIGVSGIKNPLLFLVLWEVMGASSFALVAFEADKKETKRAAWYYILSAVAGALVLMLMFALMHSPHCKDCHTLIFMLAITGFGLKCGLAFIHFWLPAAHAAAPAPVSALMSGAMNNMGILGIISVFNLISIGDLPEYAAWIVFALGITGSVGAIIFALAQNHLKRLIAYSSVENFGIMALAFGLALIAMSSADNKSAAATVRMSMIAMWMHMFNHAVLKGLLFISAGAVHIGAKTYDMDKLGGLIKKMPFAGRAFIYGAMGISGVPPFASFWSEMVLYAAAVAGLFSESTPLIIASTITIISLALLGGVASAAFTKAAGIVFLGEGRSDFAKNATDVPWKTKLAMLILIVCSILFAVVYVFLIKPVAIDYLPRGNFMEKYGTMFFLPMLLIALTGLFLFMSKYGKSKNHNRTGLTWDCGYAAPTVRMQYTGNSFSLPLEKFFAPILKTRAAFNKPSGLFPASVKRAFSTEDFSIRTVWSPVFKLIAYISEKVHHLQSGHLHLYILFMVIAIASMLVWAFSVK